MVSGTELRLESKPLTVHLVLIRLGHSRDQLRASTSNVWTVPLGGGNFSQESEPGTEPPPGIDRESG